MKGGEPADRLPGYPGLREATSDAVGPQRREAVEGDRRVGRRVGAGALDQHLVADRQRDRQVVGRLLVEHVGANRRSDRRPRTGVFASPVVRRARRIADRLVHRLGETAELADVEVDPAQLVLVALLGDQHDLRLDDAGVADHAAARLDDGLRNAVAEVLASAEWIARP